MRPLLLFWRDNSSVLKSNSMQIWYNIYISHGVALVVDLSPLNPGFFFVSTPRDALLVVDLSPLNPCFFLFQHHETLYLLLTCLLSILVLFFFQHLETLYSLLTCLCSQLCISFSPRRKPNFQLICFIHGRAFVVVNLFVSIDVDLFLVAFNSDLKLL